MKELYSHVRCAFGNVFEILDVLTGDNALAGNSWARNLLSPSWQESILNKCCLIYLSLKRLMYVPIEIIAYSNVAYISNILYPIPLTQREQFLWFTESAWKFQYLIEPTALNWKCNIFTKTCLLVLRSRLRGDSKCCSPVSDFAWFIPPWTEYFRKLLPLLAFPWWALGKYESGFKQYFYFFCCSSSPTWVTEGLIQNWLLSGRGDVGTFHHLHHSSRASQTL